MNILNLYIIKTLYEHLNLDITEYNMNILNKCIIGTQYEHSKCVHHNYYHI